MGHAAVLSGQHRQFAFIDDQHIKQRHQFGRQRLGRRCVEHHLQALGFRRMGIGNDRFQGRFQLHQQVGEALKVWEMFRSQSQVGPGYDGNRIFGIA